MAQDAGATGAAASAAAPPAPVPDPAIARAVSVLEAVARDAALFQSGALAGLRAALEPIFEVQRGRMFDGGSHEEMRARRQQLRDENRERVRERVHDQRFLENTLARADRVSKLRELMEGNAPGVPLLLDASRGKGGPAERGDGGEGDEEGMEDEEDEDEDGSGGDRREPKAHRLDSDAIVELQEEQEAPRACPACAKSFRPCAAATSSSSSSSSSSALPLSGFLCPPCAAFHARKRVQAADLTGRAALVTGARTGPGFQCVLKLLRCGASVLALTRFPRDAACRFAREADSEGWQGRLHVYGLDLRDLVAVEHFCEALVRDPAARLDILINHASLGGRGGGGFGPAAPSPSPSSSSGAAPQPPSASASASPADNAEILRLFHLETGPRRSLPARAVGFLARYEALHKKGVQEEKGEEEPEEASASSASGAAASAARSASNAPSAALVPLPADAARLSSALVPASALGPSAGPLAWHRLRLDELPTTALLQTLTANAAAPFVLTSRLKHVMMRGQGAGGSSEDGAGAGASSSSSEAQPHLTGRLPGTVRGRFVGGANKRPRGTAGSDRLHGDTAAHGVPASRCRFIVNVSAGEGRFYSARADPTHAHANMAKAALNMLTRTSAFDLAEDYIYMNAVDASTNVGPPFDDVDVAARILDPVLAPLVEADVGGGGGGPAGGLPAGFCRPAYGSFMRNMQPAEW